MGFASGVYVGSLIENWIAVGKVLVQIITNPEHGASIANALRTAGHGVTSIVANGRDADKVVLMIYANRRGKEDIFMIAKEIDEHAMIVSNDVSTLQGGYISNWRRFVK